MKLDSGDASSKRCIGAWRGSDRWKKKGDRFQPIHEVCLRPQRMRNDPSVPTEFISRSNYWSLPARPIASTPRVNFTVLTNCKLQNVSPLFPSGWSGVGIAGVLPKLFQKRHIKDIFIYLYNTVLKYASQRKNFVVRYISYSVMESSTFVRRSSHYTVYVTVGQKRARCMDKRSSFFRSCRS